MRITRWDGLIDVEQAAALCGVKPPTVRAWINRGYGRKDARRKLPVAKREGRAIYLDPVEVAKADYATRKAARRETVRDLQHVALTVRCCAAPRRPHGILVPAVRCLSRVGPAAPPVPPR